MGLFRFRRRRWFQFSLLSLFLAMTLVASVLGWYVNRPHLVLDGFCPVSLCESERWVRGDSRWTATFMKGRYYFVGWRERDLFAANPERYAALAGGLDVVAWKSEGKRQVGKRQHGMWYRGKIFLFIDEANLERFTQSPDVFLDFALQIRAGDVPSLR